MKLTRKLLDELSRRNPYLKLLEVATSPSKVRRLKDKVKGYEVAGAMLSQALETEEAGTLEENKLFMSRVYGLKTREINEYQLRINHEEYDGFFDWYHTTGTLLACHQGTQKNICKSKDAEDVAKAIQNHIYRAEGLTI